MGDKGEGSGGARGREVGVRGREAGVGDPLSTPTSTIVGYRPNNDGDI